MPNDLRIADNLLLPTEAVTQTFAILAKRGVGKTYAASVLAEEFLKAGLQVVVIDPLDVWWGLRSSADGEHPGLPITVLGGSHGDLPLEAAAAAVIADLVVEEGLSVVLSLRHLSKADQRRFVTDVCERLYHRKGEDRYRQPVHIVIDEADAFAPQRVIAGQERMLGAVDDLVRRGRASGIGVTLISQRAAVLHKDVLTQIETLLCLRTVSPQDRKALETWIDAHDTAGQRGTFMASLASLGIGEAWVWSPGWLDVFARVQIRRRETFDSSATPKVGAQPVEPRTLATVDLAQLRERLAATVERVQADDPTMLRRQIDELKGRLASIERTNAVLERATAKQAAPVVERVEVPILLNGDLTRVEQIVAGLNDLGTQLLTAGAELRAVLSHVAEVPSLDRPVVSVLSRDASAPAPVVKSLASDVREILSKGEQRILEALARRYPMRLTRAQVATLAHYTASGGSFGAAFGRLKRDGLLVEQNHQVVITDAGFAYLGLAPPDRPRTREEVLATWREALPEGARRLFNALVDVSPRGLTREELGQRTGYTATGGAFGEHLGMLRRNSLVETDGGAIRAAAMLFDGEGRKHG